MAHLVQSVGRVSEKKNACPNFFLFPPTIGPVVPELESRGKKKVGSHFYFYIGGIFIASADLSSRESTDHGLMKIPAPSIQKGIRVPWNMGAMPQQRSSLISEKSRKKRLKIICFVCIKYVRGRMSLQCLKCSWCLEKPQSSQLYVV